MYFDLCIDSTEQMIILPQPVSTRLSDYGQMFDCPTKESGSKEKVTYLIDLKVVKKDTIKRLYFKEKLRLLQRS